MRMKIRELRKGEEELLKDFLYEAIFIPEGVEPPARDIIELPELRLYYENFGSGAADHCLVAVLDEKEATDGCGRLKQGERVVGAVWTRLMKDYGYVDDETPSFAISLYKEYRGRGYGTRLMQAMLELLRSKGFRRASLAVQKANYAVHMYEKVGFVTVSQNEEEFIMTCDLSQTEKAEIEKVWRRFFEEPLESYQKIETGVDDEDFRETVIGKMPSGKRCVLKIVDNDFTFPEKIEVWSRTAEEYRKLGYYAPEFFRDREGRFPIITFRGRSCVAYGEEYAPYVPAEDRMETKSLKKSYETYRRALWQMTAKIAEKHFDYTEYPSAWCLFRTFCPSDERDEVTDNALTWKEHADELPGEFHEQTERIWRKWEENKKALEKVYDRLPTSVFQADLNSTNVLLDEKDKFVGIYDFNLCGKEVVLNYIFREIFLPDFEAEVKAICETLEIVREYYHFNEDEKSLALMLYRCLKPLYGNKVYRFQNLGEDWPAVHRFLDETERYLTMEIDFKQYLEGRDEGQISYGNQ